jgi:hypothetical protein
LPCFRHLSWNQADGSSRVHAAASIQAQALEQLDDDGADGVQWELGHDVGVGFEAVTSDGAVISMPAHTDPVSDTDADV